MCNSTVNKCFGFNIKKPKRATYANFSNPFILFNYYIFPIISTKYRFLDKKYIQTGDFLQKNSYNCDKA
jgi:hypothetical protein